MSFQVNQELCTGCEACLKTCPSMAISMIDHTAYIDQESCTQCGLCAEACPNQAIQAVHMPVVTAIPVENDDRVIHIVETRPQKSTSAVITKVGSLFWDKVLPSMVDLIIGALDQRIKAPPQTSQTIQPITQGTYYVRGGAQRRRRRKWSSKSKINRKGGKYHARW